jgi:amino acid adenylation domain-containing protein
VKEVGDELIVAVLMDKGWRQVVTAIGVLRAGGSYLPMDAKKLPPQRQQQIVEASGAALVVCDSVGAEKGQWLREKKGLLMDVDDVLRGQEGGSSSSSSSSTGTTTTTAFQPVALRSPGDLAYLIYTSGSTGLPKGVRCHHGGSMNTVVDLNSRFGVGAGDRVLALSSLSFDLSVYDIFGALEAGGAVVVPPADSVSPPDPEKWLELVREDEVTIWNTVPRYLELLVSHCEQSGEKIPPCLRLIFMSGDFIPLTLPKRIRDACQNEDLRIISMGGATEAAIWSNIYEIGASLDGAWSSIPYGQAMMNQRMYVLDGAMQQCPVWKTGVIYIGGAGVALGYHNDPAKTAYQFVKHPLSGEYLFRTGDLGRVRPTTVGSAPLLLEILGREDSQVKIGGFRVELGEVEKTAESFPGVTASCVVVSSLDASRPRLFAFVTIDAAAALNIGEAAVPRALHAFLTAQLPNYMVPTAIEVLDKLPLNSNGKADRSLLANREVPLLFAEKRGGGRGGGGGGDGGSGAKQEPKTPEETLMLETW